MDKLRRRWDILVIPLLIITTLGVYWQIKSHDFITYDDHEYITENAIVQAGLTREGIAWAFTTGHTGNWHPLTWLSHMLDCQLFGLNPGAHHLSSLFLHLASTILLFLTLRRATGGLWQSAFVASLFALHPLRVESVAWAAERKDVLSGFFWMLTMFAYVRYVERPKLLRYMWVLLAFALGLLAKPMLVTLPFVLLLMDYWPLNRLQLGQSTVAEKSKPHKRGASKVNTPTVVRLIREKIPFFALAVASSVVTMYIQQRAEASWEFLPLGTRLANAVVSYGSYIGKMIWPTGLAVFYPHPLGSLAAAKVAGISLLIVGVSALFIWKARQYPFLAFGWLWYLGTLVPVIGLVQVGAQSMADRYTYVPLVGLFISISWGFTHLASRWRDLRNALALAAPVALVSCAVLTEQQVGFWKNSITLFEHALRVTENNYVAHSSLAVGLAREGKTEEAIAHSTEAIRIKQDYAEAHNNLGSLLTRQGKITEAIAHYREAVRIKPDYAHAHFNLGFYLAQQGNIAEGITHYTEALRIKPDYADARLNLGNLLVSQGKMAEAKAQYALLTRYDPYYEKGYYVVGFYLAAEGKLDEAIPYYTKALQIKPDFAEVHYYLGVALDRKGRTGEAIAHYSAALRINPQYGDARAALERATSAQK